MMKPIRIVLLILLLPYVAWILMQGRLNPRALLAALFLFAVLVPLILARMVGGRWSSTVTCLIVTPVVLSAALYVSALGDREALAWFPIVAAWLLAITAPVWIVVSVVFGAMKDKKQKESAEPATAPYSEPAARPPQG